MVVFLVFGLVGFSGCTKKTENAAAEMEKPAAMKGLSPVVRDRKSVV